MEMTDLTVRKTVTVNAPREHAFKVWTEGFNDWWPKGHHIGDAELDRVVFEWRSGGRAYEVGVDGSECDWGRVLSYEPPSRVVVAWHLNAEWKYEPDPEQASEYEVRFVAQGDGTTLVELEHRHIERHGSDAHKLVEAFNSEGGWTGILAGYAETASIR
ncbi:MAG TPA: SRPBCC family protein [Thermoleophilaceae bacterium]